jgi:hypothetical protein
MGRVFRVFWAVLFWIWGFLGLASLYVIPMMTPHGHQMTTDDKLNWIGGLILFGLSALICRRQPPPEGPPANRP